MGLFQKLRSKLKLWTTEQVGRWLAGEDIDSSSSALRPPPYPYITSPWVHRAVQAVAGATASIPIVITDLDGQVVEESPIYSLFGSPFSEYCKSTLIYEIVGHYFLTGESHIVQGLADPNEPTIDLFGFDSMTALVSKNGLELLGWEVKVKERNGSWRKYVVDLDSVTSWIDPNLYPGTKFRGISRIHCLKWPMIEDEAAAKCSATLLNRGGGPRGFLKTEQTLTPDQADQLQERYEAKYTGSEASGRIAVLGKGTEWKSMVQSAKEMSMIENRKMSRETILSIFEVPPAVVGLYHDSNRSHDESAREGFWVNTIWPTADQVGEMLTKAFIPKMSMLPYSMGPENYAWSRSFKTARRLRAIRKGNPYNLMIWLDVGQVPAMRRWHVAQAENALRWVEAGVPLNQIIEKNDLPYETVPWGDTWWVPNNLLPADLAVKKIITDISKTETDMDVAKNPPKLPAGPKPPPRNLSPEDQERMWLKWIASWQGLETKMHRAMRAYFFRQRKEMLQKVSALGSNDSVPLRAIRAWVDDIMFDAIRENMLLIDIVTPFYKQGYTLGGAQVATEVDGLNPFELPDIHWDGLLHDRFRTVSNINGTTVRKLQLTLDQAYAAKETVQQIASRVKDVYREATDSRSLSIARTESAMSVSAGRFESAKSNGVQYKGWLTSGDEHVRGSHVAAGVKYGDIGIPIDQMFELHGGNLSHPGDPLGPASEVVNCRCVLIPLEAPGSRVFVERICKYVALDFQFKRWSETDED